LCSLPRNGLERNSENVHLQYFGSTERNSEMYSLPQKGSEQNYGILFLFLYHGTEFRVIFSSAEGFGTEFRDFLFRGTAGIPWEITICSVYSGFRGIIFLSEIPNPRFGDFVPGDTVLNADTQFYLLGLDLTKHNQNCHVTVPLSPSSLIQDLETLFPGTPS
jgi:hypothetical protein